MFYYVHLAEGEGKTRAHFASQRVAKRITFPASCLALHDRRNCPVCQFFDEETAMLVKKRTSCGGFAPNFILDRADGCMQPCQRGRSGRLAKDVDVDGESVEEGER